MVRILRRSCAVLAALVIPAAPAFAITNGQPDGSLHPEVGALICSLGGVVLARTPRTTVLLLPAASVATTESV